MIYLEKHHYEIIKKILSKYPYQFFVFGSRTKGTHRKLSDLDLCFKDPIPWNIQAHIEEEFEESNLPFTVDLVNWNLTSEQFRQQIKDDLIPFQ